MEFLPHPKELNFSSDNLGQEWETWKNLFFFTMESPRGHSRIRVNVFSGQWDNVIVIVGKFGKLGLLTGNC